MKKQNQIVMVTKPTGFLTHRDYLDANHYGLERLSKMLAGARYAGGFATLQEAMKAYEGGYKKYISDKQSKKKGGPPLF